ncbi:sensor histidine kinase [Catenovulum adriaticum]|uniref:histidine kinase n=1 Tax=Catenovulum adriaticum TaxID=2984846 RepID=A0ABY7AIC7_9ALTE|nr:HAMP domain-containing sensor histidine kinase [Catenovulum sp. TS8]WAJ69075.1 HAMP domain-containing histidine kinase [Catenovulum sp. TS8]
MKNSLCLLLQSIDELSDKAKKNNDSSTHELAKLHYEASRLNSNLLQMLSLYRAEKQQLPVNIDEYYIIDILDEIITKNQIYLDNKRISVKLDVADELYWYLDIDLISNLLNDVFINAMRYTKDQICIQAEIQNSRLVLCINDNGDGYCESMLQQNDLSMQALNLSAGHTGLGLFFAKIIADAHQTDGKSGDISLQNGGLLGGSLFKLTLP